MCSVGLSQVLALVKLVMTNEKESILTATNEALEDLEFEVALDSGSVVHVCAPADCPGYTLQESPGSRRGQEFLMGDGGAIPNFGQKGEFERSRQGCAISVPDCSRRETIDVGRQEL